MHTVSSPKAKLLKQPCKNNKIKRIIKPTLLRRENNISLYDVGKNISGFVRLKAESERVRVSHAEELNNGELDFNSSGGIDQVCVHEYRNAKNRIVHPWFSWAGLR